MARDFKAEYARRIERGIERGLARSQARGHAGRGLLPVSKLPESIRGFRPTPQVPRLPPLSLNVTAPTSDLPRRYTLIDFKTVTTTDNRINYITYGTGRGKTLTMEQALQEAQAIIDREGGKYRTCRISFSGKHKYRAGSGKRRTSYVTGPNANTQGDAAVHISTPYAAKFEKITGVQVTFKEVVKR